MSEDRMKKACAHCPFRRDVRPFLHPDRAEEIACSTQNTYADFPCHKTTEPPEYDDGEMLAVETSKTCAGWFQVAINEGGQEEPGGFEWDDRIYTDVWEMIGAYDDEWRKHRVQA